MSSPVLASLVTEAARSERLAVSWESVDTPAADIAARATRCTPLIHDFQPDAGRSMQWLDAAARIEPRIVVFPLLDAPATAVLTTLLCGVREFRCSGAALAAEQTPRQLGRCLGEAHARAHRRSLAVDVAEAWSLGPELAALARRALTTSRPHVTLQGLLRQCGMSRREFVRRVRAAGFDPPLRFFQALRVLRALDRMHDQRTERDVAFELGYGSTDTLRRQVRTVLGVTPSSARGIDIGELVRQLAP